VSWLAFDARTRWGRGQSSSTAHGGSVAAGGRVT